MVRGRYYRQEFFLKKGDKKIKIQKRGAGWEKLGKWVPPAL
jgi:hypothetical protein